MEGIAGADMVLINSLVDSEEALPVVLSWIQSHRSKTSPTHISKAWEHKLGATTADSFAVSFLNYIRAQAYPFLQSSISEPDQSPVTSAPSPDLQMPKKKSEMLSIGSEKTALEARSSRRQRSVASNRVGACPTSYEEEFPALATLSTNGAHQKKGQSKARQARRVNPTPMVVPEVDTDFVLAKVQSSKGSHSQLDPILSVSGPLKVDMDVLMDRFNKPKNYRQRERQERLVEGMAEPVVFDRARSVCSSECQTMVDSTIDEIGKYCRSCSMGKDSLQRFSEMNNETLELSKVTAQNLSKPSQIFSGKLKRVATVHAKLIVTKMVPSLIGELYFLFQLLSLEDIFLERHDELAGMQANMGAIETLFPDYKGCSYYACKALEQAGHILDCVGEHLLAALIEQPVIACHSASLLSHLRGALAQHQAAALRSFKTYEHANGAKCTLSASPSKSTYKKSLKHSPVGTPASLPFHAARDSRNNFKTPASQKIYNNRELCRDIFYAIIREAAFSQNTFGFAGSGHEDNPYKKLHESVHNFSKTLMVENYPWFCELFVEQYLQASSYGETDPEVAGLARHDAAKLQRLHDRLTSESSSQHLIFLQKKGSCGPEMCDTYPVLSAESSWSRTKCVQSSKVLSSLNSHHGQENITFQASLDRGFSKTFPQSTRMYVWFLEAADSYRLNSQLLCSVRSRICKLTKLPLYSQDAADIGSGFTQRVLSLKSLGSLIGFLFFYPEGGSLPTVPQDADHEFPDLEWDVAQCRLPIDLLEELDNARAQESLLLVLPWILDFLRMIKVVPSFLSQPYFKHVFSSLREVYSLPMLDPSDNNFGESSMCILAALDGFFEDMGMLEFDASYLSRPVLEGIVNNPTSFDKEVDQKSPGCGGIDRLLGIVDNSYIQHCCPLITAMRSIFVVAKKGQRMYPAYPQTQRGNSLRKITPIQNLRHGQSLHSSSKMLGESTIVKKTLDTAEDQVKLKLQHAFFEQRPHLQRLVDFIVDTAAVNAANAASVKCVPQVLKDAMNKLEVAITDRFPTPADVLTLEEFEGRLNASNFELATEHIITTAIQQVLPAAVEYAQRHSADRTVEALSALAAPDLSPYILSVAGGIASEAAAIAVGRKTLANVSSEIRKQVTRAVDEWRRKIQKEIMKEPEFLERVEHEAASEISSMPKVDILTSSCRRFGTSSECDKENVNNSTCVLPVPKYCMDVMRQKVYGPGQGETQKLGYGLKEHQRISVGAADAFSLPDIKHQGISLDDDIVADQRIAGLCQEVCDCCLHGTLANERRMSLRLHLASICLVIESILSKLDKGLPVGGVDAVVFTPGPTFNRQPLLDDAKSEHLRIENGLIRRCVALAAYWCLLLPSTAFGFSAEDLAECCYTSSQNVELSDDLTPLLTVNVLQLGATALEHDMDTCSPEENEMAWDWAAKHGHSEVGCMADAQADRGCSCLASGLEFRCRKQNNKACPMESLVFMWKALIDCGICKIETVILEFLSPWRWRLALLRNPWCTSPLWCGAATHGMLNTIFGIGEIAIEKRSAWTLLFDSFVEVYRNGFCKAKNFNGDICELKEDFSSVEAKQLLRSILVELIRKFKVQSCWWQEAASERRYPGKLMH